VYEKLVAANSSGPSISNDEQDGDLSRQSKKKKKRRSGSITRMFHYLLLLNLLISIQLYCLLYWYKLRMGRSVKEAYCILDVGCIWLKVLHGTGLYCQCFRDPCCVSVSLRWNDYAMALTSTWTWKVNNTQYEVWEMWLADLGLWEWGVKNIDTKLIKNELLTANRECVKMVLCLHL